MFLSKRERYIVAVTVIAVTVLLLDRYVLTPILNRQAQLDVERTRLAADLARAGSLFVRKKRLGPRWQGMLSAGLETTSADAESRVLHAVRDWSQASGLVLSSVKPEGSGEAHGLQSIVFRAAGAGPMRAVAGFLWRLQTAGLPLKITELQIGVRKAGADDLTLQLRISALCLAKGAKPGADRPPQPAVKERRP